MIRLITGTPGAGKTLYALSEILPTFKDRKIYVDGIPDLLIDHEQPSGPIEEWHTWLPDGAVLVVDECQRIWRPRSAASAVPTGVAAMETHRHHGHDLVLITQHPNLLDSNVRRLVGAHQHVRRIWGLKRSVVYEWDQATDPGRVSTAQKKVWAYKTKTFGLYKSATQHNARGQRPPWLIFVIPLAIGAAGTMGWKVISSLEERGQPASDPVAVTARNEAARLPGQMPAQTPGPQQIDLLALEAPRDPYRPETAPIFDGVRQVTEAPKISGCISSPTRCTCYTQQGTVYPAPADTCRDISEHGQFDPYASRGPATPPPSPAS